MNSNHVSLMSVSQFLRTFFWAPHKGVLFIAFIITLFSALGFVFFGYGLRVLMDGYQDAQYHFSFLVRDVLFLLMALVLTFLLSTYTRIYLLNWVCESGFSKLRVRIFDNILSAPALCLENLEASEITTRFNNDKVILESALSSAVPLAARNTLIGLGSCIFLFTLNVDLTFFFLFWLAVMLLSTLSFRIQLTGVFQAYQKTLTGIGLCVERWVDALLSTRRLYRMCAQKDFLLLSGRSFEVGVKQIVLRLKSLIWASILGFLALIFIFVLGFE